jgi:serine/threonine protein kinase
MEYKNKYLKYKNKYITLKNQIGGSFLFNDLVFLGEGGETVVYRMKDTKRALKILKIGEGRGKLLEKERNVMLTVSGLPNFPTFYQIGTCRSSIPPSRETKSFCLNDDETGGTEYQYIIMTAINGKDMNEIYLNKFRNELIAPFENTVGLQAKINEFAIFFKSILLKIGKALLHAYREKGFFHSDFDYRNCIITEDGTPYIIDFGQSTVGPYPTGEPQISCKDLFSFIGIINGSYCNKEDDLRKVIPGITPEQQILVTKNCKLIWEQFKRIPLIQEIIAMRNRCQPFNPAGSITLAQMVDELSR